MNLLMLIALPADSEGLQPLVSLDLIALYFIGITDSKRISNLEFREFISFRNL